MGNQIVYQRRFADHHRYTQQEVLDVINRGVKRQAEILITTQKDAYTFPSWIEGSADLFHAVEIKIIEDCGLSGLRERFVSTES